MTRAVRRDGVTGSSGWAKAPDFHGDPARLSAVQAATERDRDHYLRGGMAEIQCTTCRACVMVKKTSASHTSVQWNAQARARCTGLERSEDSGKALLPGVVPATCPRLSASIDHGVAEGIIAARSPDSDPDGYW